MIISSLLQVAFPILLTTLLTTIITKTSTTTTISSCTAFSFSSSSIQSIQQKHQQQQQQPQQKWKGTLLSQVAQPLRLKKSKFFHFYNRIPITSSSTAMAAAESSTTDQQLSTSTNTDIMTELEKEALLKFFTLEQVQHITLVNADGGVSNRMSFITVPDINDPTLSQRYILRIYNNGGNSRVVQFEHEILQQLSTVQLSFEIPSALPVLNTNSKADDGTSTCTKTHTILSNGDETCIFKIIPGILPKLTAVQDIGRACGELHTAMSKIDTSLQSLTDQPPYYDIFNVHHAIQTKDKFYNQILSNKFITENDDIEQQQTIDDLYRLIQYVRDMELTIEELKNKNFPIQLIHGDLHYDNVLINPDTQIVTGLLDFEYCGYDWGCMELAVCLSKYSSEDNPIHYFTNFVNGYCQSTTLSIDEILSIPDLMILRILSNVVFFVGRTITGEDLPEQLIKRAGMYNTRIQWLLDNKKILTDMIIQEMESAQQTKK